jgi:hypothetical protein
MQVSLPRLGAAALTLGTVLALGPGVASAGTTPRQAALRAIAVTEGASSVRFAGVITEGKERISVAVSGSTLGVGQGTIGIDKGTATVREVSGTVYFIGTKEFWTLEGGKSAAQLFAGKWVSTASSSQTGASLAQFLDSKLFLGDLFGANLGKSAFTNAGTSKIDGKSVSVIGTSYPKNKAHGNLYVARSGPPYILKIVVSSKSGAATVTFSNFDKAIHPAVPSGSIDLDTLSGSG